MPTLGAKLNSAALRLVEVTETPRLDAELLLAHALGISRARLLARLNEPGDVPGLEELILRRLEHEPIAYLTGTWEFYSLEFLVRKPVLVPRPETEHLVEAALEFLDGRTRARVLDLCTGTGCVAISIASNLPVATVDAVDAVDVQPHAVALARENVARLEANVHVYEGDLFSALPGGVGAYDVITANPPYISAAEYTGLPQVIQKHEDPVALLAGEDGLDLVRRILDGARALLRVGGLLALEIGDTQADDVRELAEASGWRNIEFIEDLAGHERIFTAVH